MPRFEDLLDELEAGTIASEEAQGSDLFVNEREALLEGMASKAAAGGDLDVITP